MSRNRAGIVHFLFFCFASSTTWADLTLNMPYGVTPMSHAIYRLHMTAFLICCAIAAIVFGLITYSLIKFRRSKHATPAHFIGNRTAEMIWTAVPFLILIGLAIPATMTLGQIHNTDESTLTIKITGHQWKWEYEYLDDGIHFYSYLATPYAQIFKNAPKDKWFLLEVDHPMVVPINTKVKLLITSDDVVHSWWVPELGVKQDAIPGFVNENWIKVEALGEYRGQCGELCGVSHGFMPIVVKVVSQDEFKKWVSDQQKQMAQAVSTTPLNKNELLKFGKKVYEQNCVMCHQPNGEGLAYSYPALKQSRVVTAPLEEVITYVMRGVPNAAMQPFGEILDDQSLAAVISYIRNEWGNNLIIQQENFKLDATPQDVAKIRAQLQSS